MFGWTKKSLLQFHPDKCFQMSIRPKSKPQCSHIYQMNGEKLQYTSLHEDLGIVIDEHLTFSHHISQKVNKANQIMGLIRRTITYLDEYNFKLLFVSLVRPHTEYGNSIWLPLLKRDIKLIENIQKRATKYIPSLKHLEYQERLKKVNLPTLQYRRFRGDMIETYKILHDIYDNDCTSGLFELKWTNTRGHKYALKIRKSNSNLRKHFFTFRIAAVWNSLPCNVVEAKNLNVFKNELDRFCSTRGLMFNPEIDFLDTYFISTVLKSQTQI